VAFQVRRVIVWLAGDIVKPFKDGGRRGSGRQDRGLSISRNRTSRNQRCVRPPDLCYDGAKATERITADQPQLSNEELIAEIVAAAATEAVEAFGPICAIIPVSIVHIAPQHSRMTQRSATRFADSR
jgi:hypothetical protein